MRLDSPRSSSISFHRTLHVNPDTSSYKVHANSWRLGISERRHQPGATNTWSTSRLFQRIRNGGVAVLSSPLHPAPFSDFSSLNPPKSPLSALAECLARLKSAVVMMTWRRLGLQVARAASPGSLGHRPATNLEAVPPAVPRCRPMRRVHCKIYQRTPHQKGPRTRIFTYTALLVAADRDALMAVVREFGLELNK